MAVVTITTKMVAGVKYSVTTDTSADFSSVANDVYFYNLEDEIVYYKNIDGLIVDVYRNTSNQLLSLNEQTGTTYTLSLSDQGKLVSMDNANANTLVIPLNSSVAFPIGTQILVKQAGVGGTTFLPTGGVTIYSYLNKTQSLGQHSLFTLIKTKTDTWCLGGNLQ